MKTNKKIGYKKRLLIALCATLCVVSPAMSKSFGNWQYIESVDPITDDDESYVINQKEKEEILIVCVGSNNFDVYLSSIKGQASRFMGRDNAVLLWRVDGGEVKQSDVDFDYIQSAEVSRLEKKVKKEFIESIRNGSQVVIRFKHYSRFETTFTIDLTGVKDAIGSLGCIS